jgi:hypothetical protein
MRLPRWYATLDVRSVTARLQLLHLMLRLLRLMLLLLLLVLSMLLPNSQMLNQLLLLL